MTPLYERPLTVAMATCAGAVVVYMGLKYSGYRDAAASMYPVLLFFVIFINLAALYQRGRAQLEVQKARNNHILTQFKAELDALQTATERAQKNRERKVRRIAFRQQTAVSLLPKIRGDKPRWPH